MFDNVARAHLSLTLPGWLLCLCLMHSMCACAQWLLCCALAHETSSSDTRRSSLPIVVVVVPFVRRDMKMPCACTQGLIVNIRQRHHRSCCRFFRHATQHECEALSTTLLSLSPLFLSSSPLCDATCCRALAHKAWLPSLPCNATCCHALAHKTWLLSLPCDATCCCALARKAWSPSPSCDTTCCRALVHEALSPLRLRDAMRQQLVRSCTLLLQYEAHAHAHKGLLVDNI
jgi:hypothetical protein